MSSGGNFLDDLLLGVKTIQSNGVVQPTEPTINFIGASIVDDPGNKRTNVTVSANPNAVSGTGFWHSTSGLLDGAAKLVNLSTDTTGILPLTDLAQSGAHTNDLLTWTGTQWAPVSTIGVAVTMAGEVTGTTAATVVSGPFSTATWTWNSGLAPLFNQTVGAAVSAGHSWTFAPQAGGATSGVPGSLIVNLSAPNGGSAEATGFVVQRAGVTRAWVEPLHGIATFGGGGTDTFVQIGPYQGGATTYAAIYLLPNGVTPNAGNYAYLSDGSALWFNAPGGGSPMRFNFGGTTLLSMTLAGGIQFDTAISAGLLGTNKAAATLTLQQDAAITAWTLSGGNALQMQAPTAATSVTINQAAAVAGAGAAWSITAQAGAGTNDGGALSLSGGAHAGASTADGSVKINTPLNAGFASVTAASPTNLTNAQSNANVLILTGAIGGPFTVNYLRRAADTSLVFIRNNTGVTATIAYLTGTTVTLATNTGALICSDGTNLQKIFTTT